MAAVHSPARIGTLWQQRMETLREYEIIRDGNVFKTNFSSSYVFSSAYEEARHQLERLIAQYDGVPFDAIFSGEEVTNEGGICFLLKSRHQLPNTAIDVERLRQDILVDLTLVRGIGETTQRRLKARGYVTLTDLLLHPKFRAPAALVFERLSRGDSAEIMDLIGCRHGKTHPFMLGTAGLHEPEQYVFLDIETLGLFSRPIILFGIGVIENTHLVVHQYLLRDIAEEQAALVSTLEHLSGERRALITFNGKAFDLPYLMDRLFYYGMDAPVHIPHFDVLHFSRRRWRNQFPSLRLSALEKEIFGIKREDDIPGQMVPEFYESYVRTGNSGPLVPIIRHNRQDVVSLTLLFFRLLEEFYGCC